ncbi:MAG: hypothetical protein ACO3EZ_12735 [Prochlorotrichaceae cyanobacterium]
MTDLAVLIADRSFNTSAGAIELRPFKFKDFNKALSIIERYVNVFMVANTAAEIADRLFAKAQEEYEVIADIHKLLYLVMVKPVGIEAKPVDIDDLRFDEVLSLVVEVIDMNLDFFKRIGERLNSAQNAGQPAE